MNSVKKPKIVLDIDDTLLKSSEQIINMICSKYNISRTISDLKDWNYKSIFKLLKPEEISEMYCSDEFFDNVKFNDGVEWFIEKYKDTFQFAFCTKGFKANLDKKRELCIDKFGNDIEFYGLEFESNEDINVCKLDKSSIDFSDTLFCVDDNSFALSTMNSPIKFLLKNNREVTWSKTPINETKIFVINSFYDLDEYCDFFVKINKNSKGCVDFAEIL